MVVNACKTEQIRLIMVITLLLPTIFDKFNVIVFLFVAK
ncbi:hypothetical protein EV294_10323 [Paenibacillus sp. BK033]|nr:hypothetical protein EV294_10323 [Paenibacillus sp. BK033]